MRRLIIGALLAGALALAPAGCGGGAKDAAKKGPGPRLTAAQYRAQLARICTQSVQQASRIGGVQGANAAALADYFDKIAAVQARHELQFDRLRPPADLQAAHSQIEPLLMAEIASIKQAAAGFRAGSDPIATYRTFKLSENRVLSRQAKLLKQLKVAQCGLNVGSSAGAAPGSS